MNEGDSNPPASLLPSLSVVLPCRNEAGSIAATLRDVLTHAEPIAHRLEVIVVDDASTDATSQAAQSIADARIRIVRRDQCQGYGAALRSGFAATTGDTIFYTDGDGQIDLTNLAQLPNLLATAEVVIGHRLNRAEGLTRRFNAFAWTTLVNLVFGLRTRDVDCAFKAFPASFIRSTPLISDGALISAELLARAKRANLRTASIGVAHRPRNAGKPTGANPRVIARAFVELFALAGRIRRGL